MKETNISLSVLIEEAREKFNKMWLDWGNFGGLPQPAEVELQNFITQAFHAGEAKGHGEGLSEAWLIVEEEGHQQEDDTIWCNMDKVQKKIEAARQGDKDSAS